MKKSLFLFSFFFLFIILFLPLAWAVAIGASPANLAFELSRGGSAEKTFQVSTNSETPIDFSLTESAEIERFVSTDITKGTTKLGEPAEIYVSVKVPRGTEPGTYEGTVTVSTSPVGGFEGGTGSIIATGVAVKVVINVADSYAESHVTGALTGVGSDQELNFAVIMFIVIVIVIVASIFLFILRKK